MTTYSDDSSTGRSSQRFRGLDRATIAARVDDSNGFEWFRGFVRDYLPAKTEPKADLVLEVCRANREANAFLMDHIGGCTIVVVDLGEHYRDVLSGVRAAIGLGPLTRDQALTTVLNLSELQGNGSALLRVARDMAIDRTTIPDIESLLGRAVYGVGLHEGGARELFDRDELHDLNEQEFQELAVRFGVVFADALSPEERSKAIAGALAENGLLAPARIAMITLGSVVEHDRIFDVGSVEAMQLLADAHDAVVGDLRSAADGYLLETMRAGRISEQDSRLLDGLQVADIAARIAAEIYEQYPDDRVTGAKAVKQVFDRVLVNDRWM